MTRNNTLRNSGYIPEAEPRRNQPAFRGRPMPMEPVDPPRRNPPRKQEESNDYFETVVTPSFDNDRYEYQPPSPPPPPPRPAQAKQKRVQIIDHNHRQSPSTDHQSGRGSANSYPSRRPAPAHNSVPSKPKHMPEHPQEDYQSNSAHSSGARPTNAKIHKPLTGAGAADPGQ